MAQLPNELQCFGNTQSALSCTCNRAKQYVWQNCLVPGVVAWKYDIFINECELLIFFLSFSDHLYTQLLKRALHGRYRSATINVRMIHSHRRCMSGSSVHYSANLELKGHRSSVQGNSITHCLIIWHWSMRGSNGHSAGRMRPSWVYSVASPHPLTFTSAAFQKCLAHLTSESHALSYAVRFRLCRLNYPTQCCPFTAVGGSPCETLTSGCLARLRE